MHANAQREMINIALREGLKIRFDAGAHGPRNLFVITAACSAMLGNKPVRCVGLLPGVSLSIHVRGHDPAALESLTDALWTQARHHIEDWIERAERFPCLVVPCDGAHIVLALQRVIDLHPGAMQLEVRDLGRAPDPAHAAPADPAPPRAPEGSGASPRRWWHKLGRRAPRP
ncbi:MAG: hypothetical protein V4754_16025 [Pseudomonadota bacterium]